MYNGKDSNIVKMLICRVDESGGGTQAFDPCARYLCEFEAIQGYLREAVSQNKPMKQITVIPNFWKKIAITLKKIVYIEMHTFNPFLFAAQKHP